MQAKVVGRLLKERSSLTSQKFSLASCLMCACKRGHVKVVELLVQEEAVLLDVKNKNGLKPEEVTQDSAIRELLREEHWRRARSEVWNLAKPGKGFFQEFFTLLLQVGREAELLEQQERNEVEVWQLDLVYIWVLYAEAFPEIIYLAFLDSLQSAENFASTNITPAIINPLQAFQMLLLADFGKTTGEAKAGYQGKIHKVHYISYSLGILNI